MTWWEWAADEADPEVLLTVSGIGLGVAGHRY